MGIVSAWTAMPASAVSKGYDVHATRTTAQSVRDNLCAAAWTQRPVRDSLCAATWTEQPGRNDLDATTCALVAHAVVDHATNVLAEVANAATVRL